MTRLTMSRHRWLGVLAGVAVMLFGQAALTPPAAGQGTPCSTTLTCDCESVEAGLLTGEWRRYCRDCEQQLEDACLEVLHYTTVYRALTAGGYCETNCSISGPNPYPPAPEDTGSGTVLPHDSVGEMQLRCPLDSAMTAVVDGDVTWYGCAAEDGTRTGVWVAVDSDGRIVEEAVYGAAGEVVYRGPVD